MKRHLVYFLQRRQNNKTNVVWVASIAQKLYKLSYAQYLFYPHKNPMRYGHILLTRNLSLRFSTITGAHTVDYLFYYLSSNTSPCFSLWQRLQTLILFPTSLVSKVGMWYSGTQWNIRGSLLWEKFRIVYSKQQNQALLALPWPAMWRSCC